MARRNILYLSSEIYPFAKVGGLADVSAALSKKIKEREHDIRVLIPKYKMIRDRKYNLREVIRLRQIEVPFGDEIITVSVKSGFIPDSKVQAYFLEYKPMYDRSDVYVDPKTKEGWPDNEKRFALFAKTAYEMLKVLYWQPDIIHCNDWTSALVPYYLKTVYKDDPFFENVRTILTIHNIEHQGIFDADIIHDISADTIPFDKDHPAWFHGKFNFLKAGILTADQIITVSPTYSRDILTPEYGFGLEEVLKSRQGDLRGVLNGIDAMSWNPETDTELVTNYSVEEPEGKADNRAELIQRLELDCPEGNMLVGMISRLAHQKGYDLLKEAADELMKLPITLVVLGTGQDDIQDMLADLAEQYPGRFVAILEFDESLARLIEAGADAFLMPSKYEPCGMNQMYSQRYGTPPIVHATGGLIDTVKEYENGSGDGTGFLFADYTPDALVGAVKRALDVFTDKDKWQTLRLNGMKMDFSWDHSAEMMEEIYAEASVEVVSS